MSTLDRVAIASYAVAMLTDAAVSLSFGGDGPTLIRIVIETIAGVLLVRGGADNFVRAFAVLAGALGMMVVTQAVALDPSYPFRLPALVAGSLTCAANLLALAATLSRSPGRLR